MQTLVRKLGNSAGVIIPKSTLAELGMAAGDAVNVSVEHGSLVITPVRHPHRSGWAAASRDLTESGDDRLEWPEFANADDDALRW